MAVLIPDEVNSCLLTMKTRKDATYILTLFFFINPKAALFLIGNEIKGENI